MAEIICRGGQKVLLDDADYEWAKIHKWYAHGHGKHIYAVRFYYDENRIHHSVRMHREIMDVLSDPKSEVDHIDGNPLNNLRSNLRICTSAQNKMNQRLKGNNKSGSKGVHFDKSRQQWMAFITKGKKRVQLGRFENRQLAVAARLGAEVALFGVYRRKTNEFE